MSYMHIENLYKNQSILLFKEAYALEKLHGTSASIEWNAETVSLHPGGENVNRFKAAIGGVDLTPAFVALGHASVVVYGELYGGSQQRMSATYGKQLKFCVFEVKIGDTWLNVVNAEDVAKKLGLEFVHYNKIPATIEMIDAERALDSVQAVRNGVGPGHKREGIVLRPLQEFVGSDGERVIAKHKNDEFKETATPREVDPAQQKVLDQADAIALEWVTDMRLQHVLQAFPRPESGNYGAEIIGALIKAMTEDVLREAAGEIVDSRDARKAIGGRTAILFRKMLAEQLKGGE
jgi:hypothetical protein